ncbi:hypothetical protein ACX9R5_16370 [Rathayibacter sp. CAU 1779]
MAAMGVPHHPPHRLLDVVPLCIDRNGRNTQYSNADPFSGQIPSAIVGERLSVELATICLEIDDVVDQIVNVPDAGNEYLRTDSEADALQSKACFGLVSGLRSLDRQSECRPHTYWGTGDQSVERR